ncbi:MAG: ABC transporter ATP-binding protein [Alphaproteobacteria bacterium]|nr:ABC transporter ATP-binding protein [Alphaproteobacteria bacterium]
MSAAPALDVSALRVHFRGADGRRIHAVNEVDLTVAPGEAVGLVGESGSGKSTIARAVLRLIEPTAGRIAVLGQDVAKLDARALQALRARMQIVFQDPWSSLNPRMTVGTLVAEPLRLLGAANRADRQARVVRLLARMGLSAGVVDRYPAQLSGGQLQRIGIARALVTEPALLVLDEPTSSLDLSVRAGILTLLAELRCEMGLAMLFITHDLGTLRLIADRIMVLYLGQVMETAPTERLFAAPAHPYTQALLSATLSADPMIRRRRDGLAGEIPSPVDLPPGCPFAGRCPLAVAACETARPALAPIGGDSHRAACIRAAEVQRRLPNHARCLSGEKRR